MKRAKVSSVFEATGRKRSRGEVMASRRARMSARARTNSYKARRAQSAITAKRPIITRSVAISKTKTDEETTSMLAKVNEKKTETELAEEPVIVFEGMERYSEEGTLLLLGLEEWPWIWSYEEEWTWWGMGLGWGWNPNWEMMSRTVAWVWKEEEDVLWEDDIWH